MVTINGQCVAVVSGTIVMLYCTDLLSEPGLCTEWLLYLIALHRTSLPLVLSTPGGSSLAGWLDFSSSRSDF